jgi:Cu(I)/Ag(I) efflux system membrane protein CusA/SilA
LPEDAAIRACTEHLEQPPSSEKSERTPTLFVHLAASYAWTMPIKARIDVLATGIRKPVGVKVIGQDLKVIERLAREIKAALRMVPGTSSAFERITGGYYLDIEPAERARPLRPRSRGRAAGGGVRYRRRDGDSGRRGPRARAVSVRYPRDRRSDPHTMAREVMVPLPSGASIPLRQVRQRQPRVGTGLDPHRGRAARHLHLRRRT